MRKIQCDPESTIMERARNNENPQNMEIKNKNTNYLAMETSKP
ncbi:uncharacterized protein G2W53_007988 [Senna tora]|uniref:Uncharacterized protein n=1 Tax=Senna tora TaxID=362788 RepID=A0A835CFF1_9FABA|nr:uncharacterized protein G2W53_007988 [Senna tora]